VNKIDFAQKRAIVIILSCTTNLAIGSPAHRDKWNKPMTLKPLIYLSSSTFPAISFSMV
jgi:hypothetical protein